MGYVEISHRLHRDGTVLYSFPSQSPRSIVMGISTHQHHFIDRKGKGLLGFLRNEGHVTGNLGLGKRSMGLPKHFNLPLLRNQDSHEYFQQGTFPGTIGTQDAQHFPGRNREREVFQNRRLSGRFLSSEPERHIGEPQRRKSRRFRTFAHETILLRC